MHTHTHRPGHNASQSVGLKPLFVLPAGPRNEGLVGMAWHPTAPQMVTISSNGKVCVVGGGRACPLCSSHMSSVLSPSPEAACGSTQLPAIPWPRLCARPAGHTTHTALVTPRMLARSLVMPLQVYIWAPIYTEDWSAFAPDFQVTGGLEGGG